MKSKRVLLADTDRLLLASYRECLTGGGFRVETAGDGLECVAKLRSFRPDVLVMDPELPWGWGDGVLAYLREDEGLPRVAVVLVSARTDADRLVGAEAGSLSGYYLKPLPPEHLVEAVWRVFRKRRGASDLRGGRAVGQGVRRPSLARPETTP